MKLRSESHEEIYKNIDKEMVELIDKKVYGQKKELSKKNMERRLHARRTEIQGKVGKQQRKMD